MVLPDGVKPVCTTCKGTGKVGVTTLQSLGQMWEAVVGKQVKFEDFMEAPRNVTPQAPNRIVGQIEGHKVMADADLSDIEVRIIADALKKLEDKDG